MRTANPALNAGTFADFDRYDSLADTGMTATGTAHKAGILLGLVLLGAAWTWHLAANAADGGAAAMPWMIGGLIGGFIFALITIFKKTWSPFTAPIYAGLQGLFLGGLSSFMEQSFPGIVIQAVGLTLGVAGSMLLAYSTGLIRATQGFKLGIIAATGGIMIVYLVTLVLGMFGTTVPFIHSSGPIGIGFSLFVIVIAALNLVLDFDFIEKGSAQGAPKYMEWYAAFGLMVTLIWLYIEILRLLSKLNKR